MNFFNVLRKEMMEQWRTKRLLIVAVILTVFGLGSPLLAKLTPDLLKAVPNLPAGLADMIPAPTVADAVAQYIKNMSQFGILLALLMSMGSVAQEKERGTVAMMLTHPIPRLTFLLTKFVALGVTFAASLVMAAIGCWFYTLILFEALPWGPFLELNGLMLMVFLVYIAVTLMCSTMVRTQGAAAGLAFTALVVIGGIGSLPRISDFSPGRLFSWGTSLVLGTGDPAWSALCISLGISGVALLTAWMVFRHQEL